MREPLTKNKIEIVKKDLLLTPGLHTYAYTGVRAHMYLHTSTHTHMLSIQTHIWTHVHTYIQMNTHRDMHIHIHACMHMYTHTWWANKKSLCHWREGILRSHTLMRTHTNIVGPSKKKIPMLLGNCSWMEGILYSALYFSLLFASWLWVLYVPQSVTLHCPWLKHEEWTVTSK